MKIKTYPWTLRGTSLVMIAVHLFSTIPNHVWAAAISSDPANNAGNPLDPQEDQQPTVHITRRVPTSDSFSALPQFSGQPTDAEIFVTHVFSLALVPVGK